jgi:hypothetical protein
MATEMTVIPLPEAADRLDMSVEMLTHLFANDKLGAKAVRTGDGQIMLDEKDVERMAKAKALRDKIWAKAARFEGETVGTTEAVEVYGLTYTTLYRCMNFTPPIIRTVGGTSDGGRGKKRLLNKADVMYVAELSKALGGGRGHRLFTAETLPPHCANGHT